MKLNLEEVVCHVLLQSFSHKVKWVLQVPGHVVHSLRFAFELDLFLSGWVSDRCAIDIVQIVKYVFVISSIYIIIFV